ncbi:MAG: ferrous iron transport protein B [Cyclobacteriaceae bacterium]|nr:ferrous iron transport protein B [Cyclobacteriaceae bacterium]
MSKNSVLKVALAGNPNSGKSSLFNQLTGLNQKVGNFPGVTVDKYTGQCRLPGGILVEITDLPGCYSLYPRSLDEQVVSNLLLNPEHPEYPDVVVIVADASNLKRNLFLFTQIHDLGVPVILALNMVDIAENKGISIKSAVLAKTLKVPVVNINGRTGSGLDLLKQQLADGVLPVSGVVTDVLLYAKKQIQFTRELLLCKSDYLAYLINQQLDVLNFIDPVKKAQIKSFLEKEGIDKEKWQSRETTDRYSFIHKLTTQCIEQNHTTGKDLTKSIDKIFTHKIFGYIIFAALLFMVFQAIFTWAIAPMDWIDLRFSQLSAFTAAQLPEGVLNNLLSEGILPGVAGVVIFIPQIAILFAFISILEETGYMARVVFLMDRILRPFGLNGRSVVPLVSGVACAIPAIMATRSIGNWRERLITIFVTPLMSCSARLPVYTILISLMIPDIYLWGILGIQGLTLLAMYALGLCMAILSAWIMSKLVHTGEKSIFIMELPTYKMPRWKNVGYTMYEKSSTFVIEAGKIILAISIILWVLASYGPGDKMHQAEEIVAEQLAIQNRPMDNFDAEVAAFRLENSYAGIFGKSIEPAIAPLGFDWKIGIALITSFAAREVFVGTMATIYSIESGDDDRGTIRSRMREDKDSETGKPRYTIPVSLSLLIFYAFALQCMSTIAVVYRETKGWKWPLIQLLYLTLLAYGSSLLVFQTLNSFY